MVRPRTQIALPALAAMEERAKRAGGGADLRPHRAQPQLQYRKGGAHARLSPALRVDPGGVRIGELADRERDRTGRTRNGPLGASSRISGRCPPRAKAARESSVTKRRWGTKAG